MTPTTEDLWRSLLLWHGLVQVRYDRTEGGGRGWFVVENNVGTNPKEIGRGRSMAVAVKVAHRRTRRFAGF